MNARMWTKNAKNSPWLAMDLERRHTSASRNERTPGDRPGRKGIDLHRHLAIAALLGIASAGAVFALDGGDVLLQASGTALSVVDVRAVPNEALETMKGLRQVRHWTLFDDELLVSHAPGRSVPGLGPARSRRELRVRSGLTEPLLAMRRGRENPLERFGSRIRVLHRFGAQTVFQTDPSTLQRLLEAQSNHFTLLHLRANRILRLPIRRLGKGRLEAPVEETKVDETRLMADIRRLQDFKTRYAYSEGFRKSADWAVETFGALGLEAGLHPYEDYGKEQWNVVAQRPDPRKDRPLWILCAHLDSTSQRPRESAPGADDNASGCAGVLELARIFADRPEGRSMRFVLFGGEEVGLRGSKAYVKQLKAAGETTRIAGVINLDMIGFDRTEPLTALFETRSVCEDFIAPFVDASEASGLSPSISFHPWGSDHVPFLDAKIPCFLLIESEYDANPNYHKTTDLIDDVNPRLVSAIVRTLATGLKARLAP